MELMPQGYDDRGENPQDAEACPECLGDGCSKCDFTGTLAAWRDRHEDCHEDYDIAYEEGRYL